VRAVEEAVEQADRDRFDALVGERLGRRIDILEPKGGQLLTVRTDAPAHRQSQVARRQDLRERRAMVPLVLADAAADLERVSETLGRQHADPGALLLEDRVGGDGRAVHEQRAVAQQGAERQVELLGGEAEHAQHAFAGIGRNRGRLVDAHGARVVAQNHVGEGAADIDADAPGSDEGREGLGHGRHIILVVVLCHTGRCATRSGGMAAAPMACEISAPGIEGYA
jgi:hypothetical protein